MGKFIQKVQHWQGVCPQQETYHSVLEKINWIFVSKMSQKHWIFKDKNWISVQVTPSCIQEAKNPVISAFFRCLREHLTQHKESVKHELTEERGQYCFDKLETVTQKIDKKYGLTLKNSHQKIGFMKNWNFPEIPSQR